MSDRRPVRDGEFRDPRLAALYDVACPPGPDTAFFLETAGQRAQTRVLDLGCGTGQLTIALADAGHEVTGIDPAAASLDVARSKPGADQVTWILGHADAAPLDSFDTAIMTSHVAQFFADDESWHQALAHLRRAVVDDGQLIFDSRDPADQRWKRWNPTETRTTHLLGDGHAVIQWTEVVDVVPRSDGGATVRFVHHYEFDDGERLESLSTLAFRPEATLRDDLGDAGFEVGDIFGGWGRTPVGHPDGELIILAHVPG